MAIQARRITIHPPPEATIVQNSCTSSRSEPETGAADNEVVVVNSVMLDGVGTRGSTSNVTVAVVVCSCGEGVTSGGVEGEGERMAVGPGRDSEREGSDEEVNEEEGKAEREEGLEGEGERNSTEREETEDGSNRTAAEFDEETTRVARVGSVTT